MKPEESQPCPEPQPGDWLRPSDFAHAVRVTPLVSIDLILRDRLGRILVGYRENQPAKGFYFVPGGRITKNETLAAAFARVSGAELGQTISIGTGRFLGVYEHFYSENRLQMPGFGTHYVVLAYEVMLDLDLSGLPIDQHGHYAWMPAAELLARADVHPNTKAYFRPGPESAPLHPASLGSAP